MLARYSFFVMAQIFKGMDSKDHHEHGEPAKNEICRLEWIAWAMDAARRYKEAEQVRRPGHQRLDHRDPE